MGRTLWVMVAVGVLAAAIAVAGCGGGGDSSPPKRAGCTAADSGKVTVEAKNLQFNERCLSEPADMPLTVTFKNEDPGTPHDWVLKGTGKKVGTKLITGDDETTVQVPGLPAGTYTYVCTVHPNMTGTLKVGEASPSTSLAR